MPREIPICMIDLKSHAPINERSLGFKKLLADAKAGAVFPPIQLRYVEAHDRLQPGYRMEQVHVPAHYRVIDGMHRLTIASKYLGHTHILARVE